MVWFSWIATVLGLVATIAGTTLAYFTFISPMHRFRLYLRKSKRWEEVVVDRSGMDSYWRYDRHPEFVLERGDSDEWDPIVMESWMPHSPDTSKGRTQIFARVNGQHLFNEEFVSLDGGRNFVPLPRRQSVEGGSEYWYTSLQVSLARIVGHYYRPVTSIDDFMAQQKIPVRKGNKRP
jgi:hypothetical protein